MADYQFPGQNQWSEKPVIGTGEGESPLVPAPQNEITVRTMSSDTSSIKEAGGGEPQPYKPAGIPNQVVTPPTQEIPQVQTSVINPMQATSIPTPPIPEKKGSGAFIVIAIIIIILGLGAIGYFYVYPTFFASSQTEEVVNTEETQLPEQPVVTEATTTEVIATTSPIIVPPITGLTTHTSLFKTPADFSSEITLASGTTLTAIKDSWKGTTVEVPVFRETTFKNATGTIIGSQKIIPVFFPSITEATTTQLFNEDLTLFTYTNQKGVWPGIILRAKPETLASAKEVIKTIEAKTEWKSLFMVEPGKEQKWKDGKVGASTARYISFSTQGNSLSYTWLGDVLVISTNYQAAQDAVKKLGN